MPKTKVLFLINSFLMGGAQKVVLDLASALDKEKYDVVVVSLKPNILEHNKYFDLVGIAKKNNFRSLEFKRQKNNLSLFSNLYQLIKKEKPDIIHCHLPWASIFGVMAGRLAGVKNIIIHEHNSPRFYSPKINFLINFLRSLAKISICYSPEVEKEIFGDSSIFDDKQKKLARKSYTILNGIALEDIDKIKNTIDKKKKRAELDLPADSFVVLSAARLVAWKGHDNLIQAFVKFASAHTNAYLLIAGQGEELDHLKELVGQSNCASKIKLLGSRNDVLELMAISDVFSSVLSYPSGFSSEGVGLSALEAMASALTTLIGDYPGIDPSLQNNKNLLIVKPNDVMALAEQLERLYNDKALSVSIGQAAHDFIAAKYDWRSLVKVYENLYQLIICK